MSTPGDDGGEQLTLGLLAYSDEDGHRYGADLLDLLLEDPWGAGVDGR